MVKKPATGRAEAFIRAVSGTNFANPALYPDDPHVLCSGNVSIRTSEILNEK